MQRIIKIFLIGTFSYSLLFLSACARPVHSQVTADAGFINVSALPVGDGSITNIRLTALHDAATSLGAQGALAWRSVHIDAALKEEAPLLDHVFDFNQLLLSHNVLPPILIESQDNLTLSDNETLRTANKTYKILAPARFVTAPPTWRTYLWMYYAKPDVPNKAVLPNSQAEAIAWNQYLQDGWTQGLLQANEIFSANLNRLKRDYLGMVLYRKLLQLNMISSPTVATAELGITGNKNEMRIDDAVKRITTQSELKLDGNEWKPVLTKDGS